MTLVVYYPLDKDTKDYSSNERDATNSGVSFVSGIIHKAGDFVASESDYVTLPVLVSLTAFSISLWIKQSSDTGSDMYILDYKNGNSRIAIFYNTTTNLLNVTIVNSSGTLITLVGSDINDATNTFIEIKWDGVTATLYEDLTSKDSAALAGTVDLSAKADYGYLGATTGPANYWDGWIDDFRLDNTSISSSLSSKYYNLTSGTKLVIDGIPGQIHAGKFTDYDNSYRFDYADVEVIDDSESLMSSALQFDGKRWSELFVDGVKKHFGYVVVWFPGEEGIFDVYSEDTAQQELMEPIYKYDCNSQTADTIIQDLLDTYGGGLYTYNLTSTTNIYDDIFYMLSPVQIMQELTLRENFSLKLDVDDSWTFQSRTSNDLGLTYTEGTGFYKPQFPVKNTRVTNIFFAIDSTGQVYKKRNLSSMKKYGTRPTFIDLPDATSEDQIRGYLNARVDRGGDRLIPATIEIDQDFSVVSTGLVRMNYTKLNWSNKQVYVMGLIHSLDDPTSILEMVNYSADQNEMLSRLLYDRRELQKRNIDTTKDPINIPDVELVISITPTVVVEKQTNLISRWNEGRQADGAKWNTTPTAWTEIVAATTMTPVVAALNRLRDILQGDTVDVFDPANCSIELGSGTTAETINDTALASAIANTDQLSDPGFPQDNGNGAWDNQSSVDDADAVSFTAQEIALKINSILMYRVVLDSSFSKTENEVIRVRITSTLADANPIQVLTAMLNRIRDLAEGKAVTPLNNANTYIAYGSGTTPVAVDDADLATLIAATKVGMDTGFPKDSNRLGESEHRGSVTDTEITAFSGYEAGIYENSTLMARVVFPLSEDKAAGEITRTNWKTMFVDPQT